MTREASKPTREPEVSERDSHLTEMPSPTRATDRAPLGTGQANMGSRSETSASKRSTAPAYEVRFSVVIAAEDHGRAMDWAAHWLEQLADADEAISSSANVERDPVNEDFHWEAPEVC